MIQNREKGTVAEIRAMKYLESRGFKAVAMNYCMKSNFQGGEIDLIMKKGERIHFIEVKHRSTDKFGLGRESVTPAKQKTIRRLATRWLVEKDLYDIAPVSFDVVEITNDKIEYFENCF